MRRSLEISSRFFLTSQSDLLLVSMIILSLVRESTVKTRERPCHQMTHGSMENDEEGTATLDNSDYGDIDTDVASALTTAAPADAESATLDCVGMIERRFGQEGWTTRDLYAALLQASLLSYQSSRDAQDKYGYRYINSTPSDYRHN
jgi:hypothetical protein